MRVAPFKGSRVGKLAEIIPIVPDTGNAETGIGNILKTPFQLKN